VSDRICLLELKIPGVATPLRYQSYQLANYAWGGFSWSYAPFEIKSQPEQSLELIAENASISIRNSEVIRSMVRQHDGLRRSIAHIRIIDPVGMAPTLVLLLQVASSSPVGGYYVFNLGTPTNAIAGAAVNRYFGKAVFPEIPYKKAVL
jgi:hypothetical protein